MKSHMECIINGVLSHYDPILMNNIKKEVPSREYYIILYKITLHITNYKNNVDH